MAINLSTLSAGAYAPFQYWKPSVTTEGASTWHSLWMVTAGNPAAASTPPAFSAGSGYVPTRATTGAIGQNNAAGGDVLLTTSLAASGTVAGVLTIYDRLWHCSGFGTVVTTAQNVTTGGSLTAGRLKDGSADYSDCELWGEVYTAPGATGATWTATCPDGGGVSRAWTYTHPANAETVGQMFKFLPPSGASAGCQVPTAFQASISSGTAGSIGLTVLRRIASVPILVNGEFPKSALDLGLARVRDDACLAAMVQCTATTSGIIMATLGMSSVTP